MKRAFRITGYVFAAIACAFIAAFVVDPTAVSRLASSLTPSSRSQAASDGGTDNNLVVSDSDSGEGTDDENASTGAAEDTSSANRAAPDPSSLQTTTERATHTIWDSSSAPDYYRVVGTAMVDVDVAEGTVSYSALDSLGRAGRCVANITYQMMKNGIASERGDTSQLKPSGWGHNSKVAVTDPDGTSKYGYFYNRSHLIAHSLGGEERIENVVTGTRCQNTGDNEGQDGGMAYCENVARGYLAWHHEGTLWYSATPVYEGDELVCRSVIVDMKSSDGKVDLEVEVYNAANGYSIDYATGEFHSE
jgi:DNA-entry nuclease